MSIELPDFIIDKIQAGQAILFLGAGASIGAIGDKSETPPSGNKLRDLISDKFLGGKKKDCSLSYVAELAKNESSLEELQTFIKDIFEPLNPAPFHELISSFRWRAIVSTNYDLVVEKSYANNKNRLQELEVLVRDDEQFGEKLRAQDSVPYLKLHGSVNIINNSKLPLILASEEYAKYEKNRKRIFTHLKEWGRDYPIIFCGYNLQDPNVQSILFDIGDTSIHRPSYVNINSSLDAVDSRYFSARRITPVKATLEDFLDYIHDKIPVNNRALSTFIDPISTSLTKWICSDAKPSSALLSYLENEVEHIYDGMPSEDTSPSDFYHGIKCSWDIFEKGLDIRKNITDDILLESILNDDDSRKEVKCFLLKGSAGSGKSVTLRRAAWEASKDFSQLVFAIKDGGILRYDLFREIYQLTKKRPVIVLSGSLKHSEDLKYFIKRAGQDNISATFYLSARANEWNVFGEDLDKFITAQFELRDLSDKEIKLLILKLTENNCLGCLSKIEESKRFEKVKKTTRRQILVVLHEATTGRPFEETILDEYNNIVPEEAKNLYLDICTLHKMDIPLRAGLISRISDINFEHFRQKLLSPLEHVVRLYKDTYSRDYVYVTRHPLISKLVFEQALKSPSEKSAQIIRIVKHLNVSYQADKDAFIALIKGAALANSFIDRRYADQIFEVAQNINVNEGYLHHQMAVFELHHGNGSMSKGLKCIQNAERTSDRGLTSILHTKASILRKSALQSHSPLEKIQLRKDAKIILKGQLTSSHSYYTLGQVQINELEDKLNLFTHENEADLANQRVISDMVATAEDTIRNGLQRFPDDEHLLGIQADFAKVVSDTPLVKKSLEKAFEINSTNGHIAVRLANLYIDFDNQEKAIEVLETCISKNPMSKEVHFQLAMIFINEDEQKNKDTIMHHLKSSYTGGDANINAQIWSARQDFLYGDGELARRVFAGLKKARLNPYIRKRVIGVVHDENKQKKLFCGSVVSHADGYCFVKDVSLNENVFIHFSAFDESDWSEIHARSTIEFSLGFTATGPRGVNARIIS